MLGAREAEEEWEQLAEMEGFAEPSPALAHPARAREGGRATSPGERQVDQLVQRVGHAVSAGLAARGHADDEGEAMFGWLRRAWRGNPAASPPTPPAAPVDTVLVCHYAPNLIDGEIRTGSYWTDFHSRNRGDVARITGRDPAGFNYRYELYLPRAERDRIFRNIATKMVPGLPASDEYVSRVPIPASRARPFRMP